MKIKNKCSLSRLIGKIDNDFNISESDWIPRVAAWVTDALSQMKCLPMEQKKRTLEVSDKIAQFPCELIAKELRVFDKNGNEIPNGENNKCCCSGFGGKTSSSEIAVFTDRNKNGVDAMEVASTAPGLGGRYFILDGNKIELNFNTDSIVVESYETATYYDDYYDCEVPYIYDNGLLLEALEWYVLFKYLGRGSKHPVYNLTSNSPVTNPWLQWNNLRTKAMASVNNDMKAKDDGWNNFFYNSTFLPRS